MVWKEIQIKTWSDLLKEFESIKSSNMVYRGQAKINYTLESSLKRELSLFYDHRRKDETIEQMFIRLEKKFIDLYKSESHLYLETNDYREHNELYYLSILQHYGAPTRLLDWSYSPYISTYFAISNDFEEDSILYALDLDYIIKLNKDKIEDYNLNSASKRGGQAMERDDFIIKFGKHYADKKADADKNNEPFTEEVILDKYEPNKKNIRLARQQGLFLISSKIDIDYEAIISSYGIKEGNSDTKENIALKFVIDKNKKLKILRSLQLMNISNEILFPEMEGYCKGLKYKVLNDNIL